MEQQAEKLEPGEGGPVEAVAVQEQAVAESRGEKVSCISQPCCQAPLCRGEKNGVLLATVCYI